MFKEDSEAFGRVVEIMKSSTNASSAFVILRKFNRGGQHEELYMPTLHAPEEDILILCELKVSINPSIFEIFTKVILNRTWCCH